MKTLMAILFFLPWFGKPGSEKMSQRLEEKFNRNPEACIELADKYISKYPKDAIPYYYRIKSNLNLAEKETRSRFRYKLISSILSDAYKFHRYADAELLTKMNWSEQMLAIDKLSNKMINALQAEHDSSRITLIQTKLDRIYERKKSGDETEMQTNVLEESKPLVQGFYNNQYFGMPTGLENITSFDPDGEAEVLRILNIDRVKKGMEPLEMNEYLRRAARYHANDMATQNYFDHASYDSLGGKLVQIGTTFPRIRSFYHESFVNSENIAAGSRRPEDTYHQWYTSKGHYENMFNPSSKKVGIGVAFNPNSSFGYYWVFCTAM
ncbi:MAG: hypothetical protein GC181_03500 [Bacteroidetes bacterium]|nr:hypothetical protein [Bacteroidota bacterium]